MMNQFYLLFCTTLVTWSNCAVLDPSLYLAPSPPLTVSRDSPSPGQIWSHENRVQRNAGQEHTGSTNSQTSTEAMESAETYWPMGRTTNFGLRGIHIPLTFSISGTYGNYASGAGVVGGSYASVSDFDSDSTNGGTRFSSVLNDGSSNLFRTFGKMSLAGSSYGSYGSGYPGTRIYGGGSGNSWSGWGNGKWGHYGKG